MRFKKQLAAHFENYRQASQIALVLAICASLFLAGPAAAHAQEIVESNPPAGAALAQAPDQVTIRFSEELMTQQSALLVLAADGRQVDQGDGGVDLNDPEHAILVASLPALPDGVYTVEWHIVLLDGDAAQGTYTFSVGQNVNQAPAANPSPANDNAGWPIGWTIAGLGILLCIPLLALRYRPGRGH